MNNHVTGKHHFIMAYTDFSKVPEKQEGNHSPLRSILEDSRHDKDHNIDNDSNNINNNDSNNDKNSCKLHTRSPKNTRNNESAIKSSNNCHHNATREHKQSHRHVTLSDVTSSKPRGSSTYIIICFM